MVDHIIEIDWEGDGLFAGDYDDVTADVRQGFRVERGRDQIRELAPPMSGSADLRLYNHSRRYSRNNEASPLAGKIRPSRAIRITADGTGIWRGRIVDIPQNPAPEDKTVLVDALGEISRLADANVSTQLYEDIRTDEAIGHVLDAAGWPAGKRNLDTGRTTLAWWWLDRENALEAVIDLLNTEGVPSAVYEDGEGNFVFESRHYRLTTNRSISSQATFRDDGEVPFKRPYSFDTGILDVFNAAEVDHRERSEKAETDVWEYGFDVTLSPEQSVEIVASASDPFRDAVVPVENTDFTVTNGSVDNVTISRTSGANLRITITAGSLGATIEDLKLRAKPITIDNEQQVQNRVDASASITEFGQRTYRPTIRSEIDLEIAQNIVDATVGRSKEPRAKLEITIEDDTAAGEAQLFREVSDRITIVEQHTGFDEDVWIEQIEHIVTQMGHVHKVRYGCEEIINVDIGVWDLGVWDESVWGY